MGPTSGTLISSSLYKSQYFWETLNGVCGLVNEIIPKKGLYDYESKYSKGLTDYFCPADIKSDLTTTIQATALAIHQLLGCRHYSRVDFILDKSLNAWFLEVNTLPGMTETSLVPKSAAGAGLSFKGLIEKIIMESMNDG